MLPECTELALKGLELGLPELKEYTYGFFAQTAELVGPESAALLPLTSAPSVPLSSSQ